MKIFKSYSQTSCEYECLIRISSSICGCIAWNFPQDPLQVCDQERIGCFTNEMKNFSKAQDCRRECLPDCEKLTFSFSGPYTEERFTFC